MKAEGWVGSDVRRWYRGQDHVGPIQAGLPFDAGHFDAVVAHHSLQMLAWPELVPALAELRRVTREGGVVRVSVPDLALALRAWQDRRHEHFRIDDAHESGIDGKLCMYVSQAGATRSVFTQGWLVELFARARYTSVLRSTYRQSVGGTWMTELDNRPEESCYVEGIA